MSTTTYTRIFAPGKILVVRKPYGSEKICRIIQFNFNDDTYTVAYPETGEIGKINRTNAKEVTFSRTAELLFCRNNYCMMFICKKIIEASSKIFNSASSYTVDVKLPKHIRLETKEENCDAANNLSTAISTHLDAAKLGIKISCEIINENYVKVHINGFLKCENP